MTHQPVLLQEVIAGLQIQPGETVLDLTVNRGGHSREFCERVASHGRLIGIDADREALKTASLTLKACPCPVTLLEGNFRDLDRLFEDAGLGQVDVALGDLGMSSEQLAESGRGFSFQRDEPLGMTFVASPEPGALTAYEIVNFWQEAALADIVYAYAEERFARRIARAIVAVRTRSPIETTGQLVEAIKSALPAGYQKQRRHFATKTFQALRIAANDELGALQAGLTAVWRRLNPNGRLGVITFHSLEARAVKKFFRDRTAAGEAVILTKHAVRPGRQEILTNPRARSAQLRIIKKTS